MSQEINAGPLRFTATVSFNGSDEARRYAELNRAASEAKERSYDEAVELLRQAKALKGDMYEDSRLAKFLQTAGRFDEAMAEVHWLIDRAGIHAQSTGARSASVQQFQRVNYLIKAHEAGALICKREKRPELRAEHEQRLDKLWAMHAKLSELVETENEARWAARDKEREARSSARQSATAALASAKAGRACLKCGHINPDAVGGTMDACPQCGAIYAKVERAQAERHARVSPELESAPTNTLTERYNAAEQRLTQRTGLGMGAWMLVLLVAVPVTWLFTTQERRPSSIQTGQTLQQAQAEKAQRELIQNAILEKRVLVGMTAAQAQSAWGDPSAVNRSETAHGKSEQWVYRKGSARTNYIYLRNGVVSSIRVFE